MPRPREGYHCREPNPPGLLYAIVMQKVFGFLGVKQVPGQWQNCYG
jgi:hypothetical protein